MSQIEPRPKIKSIHQKYIVTHAYKTITNNHMVSNIVLVTIDCLRYDRCGFNGYHRPTTPTLSKLAQESTIYDRAYTSGPYTPESFTGILAGRSGRNSPYLDDRALSSLPKNSPTLASEMRDLGFDTIAVVTNPQLSD